MSMPSSSDDVATSAGDPAGLQVLLDPEPLLPGDRAVVREDELLAGELVQPLRQPLGEPPAVREDDRRAMGPDQLEQPRVDRRPDARPHVAERDRARRAARRAGGPRRGGPCPRPGRRPRARAPCGSRIDDLDLATGPDPAEEPGDRLERPLRRRQADPLERRRIVRPQALQALEREGEVRPALRAGDRVDLVDDHGLDAAERLARRAGEQQVEALRRRDQDVRRAPGELPALLLRACRRSARRSRSAAPARRAAAPPAPIPWSGARRFRSTS